MVDSIFKSDKIVGKLFADGGAYDGNDIFEYLEDNAILSSIKVRKIMLDSD